MDAAAREEGAAMTSTTAPTRSTVRVRSHSSDGRATRSVRTELAASEDAVAQHPALRDEAILGRNEMEVE
jgi:hypothetical protein